MAKLFIICGHGAGDPGAIGNGFAEAERVRALGKRLKELGGKDVELGDVNRNYYADNGISTLNIAKDYQICELHLDSVVNQTAKGGHVIIKDGLEPDKYDTALANFLSNMFPGRSQSIVKHSDLANVDRAYMRGYGYRLIEVCFITNKDDITKFNSNIDAVAEGILKAFDISPIKSTTTTKEPTVKADNSFKVEVASTKMARVKIRKNAGIKSDFIDYLKRGTYTIVDTQKVDGYTWGKLKSGGWVALDFVKRV